MVMFDFQPQFECRCWFDGFQPQDPETDAQQGMDKEMESNFQLETTWIGNNLQLLCARSKCHSHNSSRFLYCELQQKFSSTYNWWFTRETAEKWKNSWWMMKKVWRENVRNERICEFCDFNLKMWLFILIFLLGLGLNTIY